MKKITISIILLFFCTLSSQGQIDADTIYHSDTIISRSYNKNGKILIENSYIKNTIISRKIYQYEKSQYLYSIENKGIKETTKTTQWRIFYLDGTPKAEYATIKRISIHGKYKTYYQNGNPQCDCNYKNDKRDSLQIVHYENGQLWSTGMYVKDKREGKTNFYYKNGQLNAEVKYKNGRPWVILNCFDANGNPVEKGTLKDGNGTYYLYNTDGELQEVGLYKNGKLKKKNYIPPHTDS